ncbi:MAG TPA: histidine phosphatase family protein [Terriglobia bacterium]|nr:histidine phosphatase family protein [Terriglobia bacterium]
MFRKEANIYLIRHGETDWNRSGRLQGLTDVPLNRTGIVQAIEIGHCLRRRAMGCVFTSPLRRASDTARLLRGSRRWPVIADDELREIDHGVWTGLEVSEIARRLPDDYRCWQSAPEKLRLKRADSVEGAYHRVGAFLSRVMGVARKVDVAVVSHGVLNGLMVCAAMGFPLGRMGDFPVPNASICVLQIRHGQIDGLKGLENATHR